MSTNRQARQLTLAAQRLILREQLQAQRRIIAMQLDSTVSANPAYPRSKTMRFLNRRSGLMSLLASEAAKLLVSVGFVKSLTAALRISKIFRSTNSAQ